MSSRNKIAAKFVLHELKVISQRIGRVAAACPWDMLPATIFKQIYGRIGEGTITRVYAVKSVTNIVSTSNIEPFLCFELCRVVYVIILN